MFTQCPQCLTYFQVTPEHLKVAQGNVRCGQCQNVFSALGNLTELPPEAANQLATPIASKPPSAKRSISSKIDDFANDLKPKIEQKPKKLALKRPANVRPATAKTTQKGLGAAIDAMNKLNKASTGLQMLDDGRRTFINQIRVPEKTRLRNIAPQAKVKDFAQEIEEIVLEDPATIQKPPARSLRKAVPAVIKKKAVVKKKTVVKKKSVARTPMRPPPIRPPGKPGKEIAIAGSNSDVDLQKALLAIDELDLSGKDSPRPNNPLSDDFFKPASTQGQIANRPNSNNLSNFNAAAATESKIKPLGRPNPGRALVPQPAPAPVAAAAPKNMMQLIPKPLLADFQQAQSAKLPGPKQRKSFNIWILGCMVLMVVFLGQTIYFKHDDLAKNQSIRPWIETFCEQANCEVSLPYEVRQLELLGQDIRSHPKISKALLVSVTIINNARFTQAYPGLQITFTDMNDQKVAMRRFRPDEFLSNRTSIGSGMPSNTPVQVEIKILDPGSKAVNFEFSFFNAG